MTFLSAALLSGGKSTRMGRDKCLLEIDGLPLWQRQSDILASLAQDLLVVAPTQPEWLPPGFRWAEDVVKDHGPLGGLATALEAATHPNVLALAIDLPAMSVTYLRGLTAMATADCGIVPEIDGLFQPLSAVYPRSALPAARAHLALPDKSLQSLLRQLIAEGQMRIVPVSEDDLSLFRNLNAPTD
ncbi:MAG TPA: molybdenum cofactor guanylyltransferase [Chthoniobacterales bacterium]